MSTVLGPWTGLCHRSNLGAADPPGGGNVRCSFVKAGYRRGRNNYQRYGPIFLIYMQYQITQTDLEITLVIIKAPTVPGSRLCGGGLPSAVPWFPDFLSAPIHI